MSLPESFCECTVPAAGEGTKSPIGRALYTVWHAHINYFVVFFFFVFWLAFVCCLLPFLSFNFFFHCCMLVANAMRRLRWEWAACVSNGTKRNKYLMKRTSFGGSCVVVRKCHRSSSIHAMRISNTFIRIIHLIDINSPIDSICIA